MLEATCTNDMELKDWLDSCERLLIRPTKEDYERYFDSADDNEE